jgi:hypothetical protein
LRSVIDRLTLPCASCPARETARRVERLEQALELYESSETTTTRPEGA